MTVKTSLPSASLSAVSPSTDSRASKTSTRVGEPRQQHPVLERIEQTLDLIEEVSRIDETDRSTKRFDVSLIVPVFNQRSKLPSALERMKRVMPVTTEIIVVDDGSTDGTDQWLASQPSGDDIRVLRRRRHHGRGSAARIGIRHSSGRVIAIQNSDLDRDPAELLRVIWPVLDGDAEVVYGSRLLNAQSVRQRGERLGNWIASQLTSVVTGLRLTDVESGYQAFDGELLRSLDLREPDDQFVAEITAKIANQGARTVEVPVFEHVRETTTHPRSWRDRLTALRCTWSYRRG